MELIVALLLAVIGCVQWGLWYEIRRLYASRSLASTNAPEDSEETEYDAEWEERKQRFRRHLDARIGAREPSDALDYEILEARKQAPILRRLVQEELPKTIRHCMGIHLLSAVGSRVEFIYEIALEPECFAVRERVVSVAETAVERLERYPLLIDEPILTKNLITIRARILPTCRDCPYLRYRIDQAPELCPSAEIAFGKNAGVQPENPQDHDRQD